MKSLLWKDYRLNRPLLLLWAAIWLVIYLAGAAAQMASACPAWPSGSDWGSMLIAYGTVGSYLSFCFTGLLGANTIACERADRSAHFLASLPLSKVQILVSKLIVAASAIGLTWSWIVFSVHVLAPRLSSEPVNFSGTIVWPGFAAVGALTFGVGWLASASMEKTIVPIILALVSPVAVTLVLLLTGVVLGIPNVRMSDWSNPVCLGAGVASFVTGTWNYCRRVEP